MVSSHGGRGSKPQPTAWLGFPLGVCGSMFPPSSTSALVSPTPTTRIFAATALSVELNSISGTDFQLGFFEVGWVLVYLSETQLTGEVGYGGTTTRDVIDFDPLVHKFFAVAEQDGIMSAEVSNDGVSWTPLHERAADFDLEFGHYELNAISRGTSGFVELDNVNGGGQPTDVACALDTRETFDQTALDPAFTGYTLDCSQSVVGGVQRWALSNTGGAQPSCGIESAYRVDVRDRALGVENVSFPQGPLGQYTDLGIAGDGGEAVLYVFDNIIRAQYCDPDCFEVGSATLDETAHKYWQIRSDTVADELLFEGSPDVVIWTGLAAVREPFELGVATTTVQFGNSVPSNAVWEIDNFSVSP